MSVDDVRAVHFAIDNVRAQALEDRWVRLGHGAPAAGARRVPGPPGRAGRPRDGRRGGRGRRDRGDRAAAPPRRTPTAGTGCCTTRVGERIAAAVSRVEHVNATIVPFDVEGELRDRRRGEKGWRSAPSPTPTKPRPRQIDDRAALDRPRHGSDPDPPASTAGPGRRSGQVAHGAAVGQRADPAGAAHRRPGEARGGLPRAGARSPAWRPAAGSWWTAR